MQVTIKWCCQTEGARRMQGVRIMSCRGGSVKHHFIWSNVWISESNHGVNSLYLHNLTHTHSGAQDTNQTSVYFQLESRLLGHSKQQTSQDHTKENISSSTSLCSTKRHVLHQKTSFPFIIFCFFPCCQCSLAQEKWLLVLAAALLFNQMASGIKLCCLKRHLSRDIQRAEMSNNLLGDIPNLSGASSDTLNYCFAF